MPLDRRTQLVAGALSFLLALSLSCSDGAGPVGQNLSGTWTFGASLTASGSRACTTSNFTMQLHQSGASLSGTYTGTLSCTEQGAPLFAAPVAGNVVNGQASAAGTVAFYFDDQSVSFTGTLNSADAMAGQANWWFNAPPPTGTVVFSGTWSATR